MSIRRWSNTVGVIKYNIKPFGDSWIQLITPIVFDHLMKLKELFLNPYIYMGSKQCRKTQSGSHLFLYRTNNICNARYHCSPNYGRQYNSYVWRQSFESVFLVRGVKAAKVSIHNWKIPWCLILYYYYAWIISSSIETLAALTPRTKVRKR